MHTRFVCTNLKEGAYLEDPGKDSRVILQWRLNK
jgi:hypothetical protein